MKLESEVFSNAVRAQLNTSSSKPCSYFATLQNGTKVFVKGPYVSQHAAKVQADVHAFKKFLAPELPSVECEVMNLIVDEKFLNCQFGARTTWPAGTPGWFLVCEDLLQPFVDGELPTKKASSKKWSEPVDVVDFDDKRVASVFQHIWYDKTAAESIYEKRPDLALQYVQHVLLSWVCGCGADLANRNFFIRDDKVYQIDLEAWAKFDWELSHTTPANKRTKANAQLVAFVEKHWEQKLRPFLESANEKYGTWARVTFFIKRGLDVCDMGTMKQRLAEMQTLEGLVDVLTREPRKPKRARVVDECDDS